MDQAPPAPTALTPRPTAQEDVLRLNEVSAGAAISITKGRTGPVILVRLASRLRDHETTVVRGELYDDGVADTEDSAFRFVAESQIY